MDEKIDVRQLLYDVCEDEAVFDDDIDLIESGLLDSYAIIMLLSSLEERGVSVPLTRIDRNLLRTSAGIEQLVTSYRVKH